MTAALVGVAAGALLALVLGVRELVLERRPRLSRVRRRSLRRVVF